MKFTCSRIRILITILLIAVSTALADDYNEVQFSVSVWPGFSTANSTENNKVLTHASLNIFGGRYDRLEGVELGSILNWQNDGMVGVQWSGMINNVGDSARGLQWAGLLNHTKGDFDGLQWAGLINSTEGSSKSLQWAGILNRTADDFRGLQWAGLVNLTNGASSSLQFAGLLNGNGGKFTGVQLSGLVNSVWGDFKGLQMAGLVNIAKRVKGVQLGVINIAEEIEGAPIGLFSYVKYVGVHYDLWFSETGVPSIGLRSGGHKFYNLLALALNPTADTLRWMPGLGLGYVVIESSEYTFSIDVMHYSVFATEGDAYRNSQLSKLRFIAGRRMSEKLTLYGGVTWNVFTSNEEDGEDFAPWSVYHDKSGGTWVRMWPGIVIGFQL